MKLQNTINILKSESSNHVFGETAHKIMAPYLRDTAREVLHSEKKVTYAATLLLLYEKNNETYFTLIKRPEYNGTHSGQISFPGGKLENNETSQEAALRETQEEIGIKHCDIKIITKLTQLYIPPSNMLVTPYVGYLDYAPTCRPDPQEVASILEVPLTNLFNDELVKTKKIKVGKHSKTPLKIEVPYFDFANEIIWGATAMILSEVKEILKNNF